MPDCILPLLSTIRQNNTRILYVDRNISCTVRALINPQEFPIQCTISEILILTFYPCKFDLGKTKPFSSSPSFFFSFFWFSTLPVQLINSNTSNSPGSFQHLSFLQSERTNLYDFPGTSWEVSKTVVGGKDILKVLLYI